MRTPPEQKVVCHVCGARYIHHNKIEVIAGVPRITSGSTPCPRCDAPMQHVHTVDIGMAKDLLLTALAVPSLVQVFGSVARFFAERVATAAQLDALLQRVHEMDYDAWLEQATRFARGDRELTAELRHIPVLKQAAAGGPLRDGLLAAAAQHRAHLEVERARHLAIAAARKHQPRDAW